MCSRSRQRSPGSRKLDGAPWASGRALPEAWLLVDNMHCLPREELRAGILGDLVGIPGVEMNEVALEEALVSAVAKIAHVDTLDTPLTEELLQRSLDEVRASGSMGMGNAEAWEVRNVES